MTQVHGSSKGRVPLSPQAFNGRGGPFLPTPMIGGFPRPMGMGGSGRGMHGMNPMAGRGMNGMMAGRGMNGMGGMPAFGMGGEHVSVVGLLHGATQEMLFEQHVSMLRTPAEA